MSGMGLSFSELCCLFCCPPCPSRIAAKLAFLPPEPTYAFEEENSTDNAAAAAASEPNTANTAAGANDSGAKKYKMVLFDKAEWQFSEREKEAIEVFYTRTAHGNRIACMFVRCSPNARFTLLHSHGNAVDLGQMSSFYMGLGSRINCNIFSYDYSGYGASSGKASEKNLYADIEGAWNALRTRYGISPENIILYGQSIGTVPTVDLASRYEVGAVVLHSALMSGMRVAFPQTKRTWFFDAFPSIDKIPKVTSPVLVIHGTEDEVIDFSHGLAIYEKCPRPVEPLWVEGAGHNDVELYSHYLDRLRHFVAEELPNCHQARVEEGPSSATAASSNAAASASSLSNHKKRSSAAPPKSLSPIPLLASSSSSGRKSSSPPTSSHATTKCDDKSDDNSSVALLSDGSKDSLTAGANVVAGTGGNSTQPDDADATNHIGPKREKFL